MKTRLSAAAAVLLLLLSGALPRAARAEDCLDAIKKIDAALASARQINQEPFDEVRKLQSIGRQKHNEGQHGRAGRYLKRAMKTFDRAVARAEAEAAKE